MILWLFGVAFLGFWRRITFLIQLGLALLIPVWLIISGSPFLFVIRWFGLVLLAAMTIYLPLCLVLWPFHKIGFVGVFERYRVAFFLLVAISFVIITFNLSQLIGII